jgi:hypothetical protein
MNQETPMTDLVERLRKFAGLPPQDNNASLWALEAADEIERLRAWQDQHDCCMCGSRMSDHDIGSGHSPVSMYDYYQLQLEKRAEAAEAKLATAVKALKAVVSVADRKTDEFDLARAVIAEASND